MLNVRVFDAGPGADEAAGLKLVGYPYAALEQQLLQSDAERIPRLHVLIESNRLGAFVLDEGL